MSKAYDSITQERRAQDAQWGGPAADDQRDIVNWTGYIEYQLIHIDWLAQAASVSRSDQYRERFVKIAALCVAAIDSLDRKYP